MALPSQSARPIRIRGGVSGRRRRRRGGGGFIVGLILVGAAGGATWLFWPESSDEPPRVAPEDDATIDAMTFDDRVTQLTHTHSPPHRASPTG